MERRTARVLLAVALAAGLRPPAAADEVPSQFCTGQNCLADQVKPQVTCKGMNCGEQPSETPSDACSGQNCDPIPDQVQPEPKVETVEPDPEAKTDGSGQ